MRRALLILLAVGGTVPLAAQSPAAASPPLTLAEAITLGRRSGIEATLARIGERVAQNKVGQRRATLLPTLDGAASVTRQTLNLDEFGIPVAHGVTDPFTVFRVGAEATQAIVDVAAWTRLKGARDSAIAAGADARAAGELSGAAAGIAWLRLLSAQQTVTARTADSAVAVQLLSQATDLVAAGVSPAIDQTRSRVSLAAIQSRLEVARNAVDRARLDLIRTLGLPSDTTLVIADSVALGLPDLPMTPEGAVAYAREHRPELAAEEARTAAAERRVTASKWDNLPSLRAGAGYTWSGQETGTLAGSYNLRLGLAIPIFDGFRRQLRTSEEGLLLEAQRRRENDLRNRIDTEAREALLDLSSARHQTAVAVERLGLAEQELAQANERFQSGVAGTVETTNAQASVLDARDALIQARVNGWTALVNVYRALGAIEDIP